MLVSDQIRWKRKWPTWRRNRPHLGHWSAVGRIFKFFFGRGPIRSGRATLFDYQKYFLKKKNISFIWHRPLKLEMKTTEHVSRDLIEPPSWMRTSRHPLANELDLWSQLGTIDGQWTAPHLYFCLRPRKFFVPGVCVSRSCPPFLASQRLLGSTWTQKMASTTFHQLPIDV